MNCERNICYQQDYNGGCDTCPCNDEPQECKEENVQSMTNQEIIEQLESLKCHCEDFREEEDCVWSKDVEALDRAIEALGKQIPYRPKLKKNMGHYWGKCKCTDNIVYNLDKSRYCENCGQLLKGKDKE